MHSWAEECKKKLIPPQEIEAFALSLKEKGRTIATINGSFDLMHAGHLEILYQASQTADILIAALNTDSSIQRYKSPFRPIVQLEYRLRMMTALSFVDYATWFDETNPCELLEKIKPNIHINGAEYGENCIESSIVKKFGGIIKIVDIVPGLSTSHILDKIRSCAS